MKVRLPRRRNSCIACNKRKPVKTLDGKHGLYCKKCLDDIAIGERSK